MDKKGVLMFTDIEDPQFDSTIPQNGSFYQYIYCYGRKNMIINYTKHAHINFSILLGGVDYATGMKRIHAIILPHGEVISGVRVFREAYNRVGMSWLYSFTKIPWIGKQAERVYEFWAAYRTQLTRGEDLDTIIARRNELLQSKLTDKSNICIEDSCKVV